MITMSSEKEVILKVDPQRRIAVEDVVNMLKGLRNQTFIEVVSTSEHESQTNNKNDINSFFKIDKLNESKSVIGNTDLPQIRELNEIAALLRSMGNLRDSFEN